jgi:hypothetical protein
MPGENWEMNTDDPWPTDMHVNAVVEYGKVILEVISQLESNHIVRRVLLAYL